MLILGKAHYQLAENDEIQLILGDYLYWSGWLSTQVHLHLFETTFFYNLEL